MSHIAPKWAYKWMKSEGGVIGTARQGTVSFRKQDGDKHYLLCASCEDFLGKAEDYLSRLTRGTSADLASIGVTLGRGPTLAGINHTLITRGLLGILYKVHYARAAPYDQIRLDQPLIERLRTRILNDDYPDHSLLVVATKWMAGTDLQGANPKSIVIAELLDRPGGAKIFDLFMGGWSWSIVISSAKNYLKGMEEFTLRPNGSWRLMFGDLALHRYFAKPDPAEEYPEMAGMFKVHPDEDWSSFAPNAPCPCGLGSLDFGACCQRTWLAAALA
ncbi:hypothetical protein Acy02nite_89930 [Actinoplanes cyaneus]|uniref:Uncharacterized protein n=1 Tax=Actinoplanes cyaneus TaxID=52696 RepID=A0A919ITQ0_9ACTN|nr:hypothetical protein [Actinoplanes cyaneus]GID71112.1 hypothetical protein Acy02nite_89930 [Actinoplanes cyaneus]